MRKQRKIDENKDDVDKINNKNQNKENLYSWIYSSFENNKIFDTQMVGDILEEPSYTDNESNISNHGLILVSEM